MAASLTCRACGTELRAGAKFCDECGVPTTMAADAAEYKQVTVLFADVVRSMDMAATLDVERFREIITQLVQQAAAVVARYGGTAEYTGDGVMAVFGAPVALEDHAFRGCLAALSIQGEAHRLAVEVARRDGVTLLLRIGLNSGQVIAGGTGSGLFGYRATGEQVGLAQRIESAAPPGGVMLSESTARLVEHLVTLGEPEQVHIKWVDEPVAVRRLVSIDPRRAPAVRNESRLAGRRGEMATLIEGLDRALNSRGAVMHVVGPPGIGKSRTAREAARLAATRGVRVVWTFCESHTRDIPFHAIAALFRAGTEITGLDDHAARARVRERLPGGDRQDLLLLDDLLGIADPQVPRIPIDPDARRRRLTALVNTATLARTEPLLLIIEDAHWIDDVSDSLLADFLSVIPQSPSVVLITARPEYRGALTRLADTRTIILAPLDNSDITALLTELLGTDPSLAELMAPIARRAAGNPFFAEEMVRELAQRGVLDGAPGRYVCRTDVSDVVVPATVQTAIEARIDRLPVTAKRTLNAASVIGVHFDTELLATLGVDAVSDELTTTGLIDQVQFGPNPEYAFRHPLTRAVAYESQLRSDRTRWHRRLAIAIEDRDPAAADENAALIAEHLEAAGELHTAYAWHMRAGAWAADRDITAARHSWERARQVADALPDDDPERLTMRITPRTMLCGIAWRVHVNVAGNRFDELRELCTAAGDKASLATGMAGLAIDHALQARLREASQLASEAMSLIDSIGDPALTVGLSFPLIYAKAQAGAWRDLLQWSQKVIDLADTDQSRRHFVFGSPLALACTARAAAGYCLGRPGWSADLHRGLAMARSADPLSLATIVAFAYFPGIAFGVLAADDSALRDIEVALHSAERSGEDMALAFVQATLGVALVHRDTDAERSRGRRLLTEVSEVFRLRGHNISEFLLVNALVYTDFRYTDHDVTIPRMFSAIDQLVPGGQLLQWGYAIPATGVLVQALLDNGADAEAEAAIERLATAPAEDGLVMRDLWLLRLRALLTRARGDESTCRDLLNRHRNLAESLGYQGHIIWSEAMRRGSP